MFSRAELKNGAKDQLRGKWLLAVLVFICYSVILQLINIDLTNSMEGSMLGISLNIIGLLVFGSIEVGMCRFTLKLAHKDETTQFNDLFSGFDVFIKALVMNLIISVCVVIGSMLFIIPGIIFGIMFSQANYILAENPEQSAIECIKESINMMKGYKFHFFVLQLSFIGWLILASIPFGIGLLWYVPYYQMTMANFYLLVKGNYKRMNEFSYDYKDNNEL
ncbi:DUF975 family protein [Paraclostridium sordellii]|uniref:DUF975 family protein n=1 Tax=Paraclostridium sordellii TaxID=1505 RepID=UPI0003865863|nr:DUF975 family protein [Paeniclostridium sordellii]EPZ62530.1 hypothetical protein H476_3441 [[Clostridium] sordellii VPI 9048] [Paeniclostridium sordellii VPI 9048]CEK37889.1 putative membrane protein [[Clostridium] sordellii] [Paeniclostridium sordellii]